MINSAYANTWDCNTIAYMPTGTLDVFYKLAWLTIVSSKGISYYKLPYGNATIPRGVVPLRASMTEQFYND